MLGLRTVCTTTDDGILPHDIIAALCRLWSGSLHVLTQPVKHLQLSIQKCAQAALLSQVQEKRAKKERDEAAKQAEDEKERMRVIGVLAEERVANRGRCVWIVSTFVHSGILVYTAVHGNKSCFAVSWRIAGRCR